MGGFWRSFAGLGRNLTGFWRTSAGLWRSCLRLWRSLVGFWRSFAGLWRSLVGLWRCHAGLWRSLAGFWRTSLHLGRSLAGLWRTSLHLGRASGACIRACIWGVWASYTYGVSGLSANKKSEMWKCCIPSMDSFQKSSMVTTYFGNWSLTDNKDANSLCTVA